MKDLKRYNKLILSIIFIVLSLFLLSLLFKFLLLNTTTFYYLTSDYDVKSEKQVIPEKISDIQLVRHYFAGPINLKKFKKDIYNRIEIDNVYFLSGICKIILSEESSLIFMAFPDNLKYKFSKATFLSLKKTRQFKDIKTLEFYIYQRIKVYSYPIE